MVTPLPVHLTDGINMDEIARNGKLHYLNHILLIHYSTIILLEQDRKNELNCFYDKDS